MLMASCGVVDDVGQHNLLVENIYIPKKWCWVEYVQVVSNDTSDFVKKENIKISKLCITDSLWVGVDSPWKSH